MARTWLGVPRRRWAGGGSTGRRRRPGHADPHDGHGKTEPFPEAARRALVDSQLRRNLRKATTTIRDKRARVVGELDDWAELRQDGKAIKDQLLANLDTYLVRFEEAAT